ncbi:MAG: hypothetical protein ACE5JX_15760, partial [Acidobacteriota bacterium]
QIQVFGNDGEMAGDATAELAAGSRISRLLTDFVPASAGQNSGYIVICSSQPLIGQQLFGTFDLRLLSAVPPTIVE